MVVSKIGQYQVCGYLMKIETLQTASKSKQNYQFVVLSDFMAGLIYRLTIDWIFRDAYVR